MLTLERWVIRMAPKDGGEPSIHSFTTRRDQRAWLRILRRNQFLTGYRFDAIDMGMWA